MLGSLPGYWMASANGEVYPFGARRTWATPPRILGAGVRLVELRPSPSQEGYYVLDSLGRVHAFGDAVDRGDVDRSGVPAGRGRLVALGDAGRRGLLGVHQHGAGCCPSATRRSSAT